ncbi:MAG: glycosyltransferase family 2 protein, partial [Deltaproteobacteria bacterium]|nr:glycosyltransferase family 2 protein [Deltaproteobacteria bacterium]
MLPSASAISGRRGPQPSLDQQFRVAEHAGVYRQQRIAVAIPAFKTESTILDVIRGLPEYVDHIIVVDDASPDTTWQRLQAFHDARLTTIRHESNQGVGGAMRTAFRGALQIGCDVVVKVDGDGQMEASRIANLLDAIIDGPCDYAKGNRFLHREALAAMPRRRMFGSMALMFLTKMASGYWHIFDPQNGFIACRASVLARLELDRIASDYFFENDMLIHLNILACRVVDVPMPARYGNEVSSMKISRILLTFPLRLFRGYWR